MIHRSAFGVQAAELGPRNVRVICSTDALDRAGEVVVQSGIDLDNYRRNPVVLWGHDPDVVIGRALSIALVDGRLEAEVEFVPAGIVPKADEICAMAKSGFINAVSIGFNPTETEPMDPKQRVTRDDPGPQRYLKSELMEFSFVSVPANPEALVVQRRQQSAEVRMANTVTRTGSDARAKTVAAIVRKGLYGVAQLAYLLEELGWQADCAAWEKECEGDASKVPAMLGEALRQLGDALVAMTQEETAELLASLGVAAFVPSLDTDAAGVTLAFATPADAFRAGVMRMKRIPVAVTKAGKAISAANAEILQAAMASHDKCMKAMAEHAECMKALGDILPEKGDPDADENVDDTQSTGTDAENEGDSNAEKSARLRRVRALMFAPA